MGVIYKITNNQNGKAYIGQTKNFNRRIKEHKKASDDYLIHKAIQKYGCNNFTYEIIEECNDEDLSQKERY